MSKNIHTGENHLKTRDIHTHREIYTRKYYPKTLKIVTCRWWNYGWPLSPPMFLYFPIFYFFLQSNKMLYIKLSNIKKLKNSKENPPPPTLNSIPHKYSLLTFSVFSSKPVSFLSKQEYLTGYVLRLAFFSKQSIYYVST